MTVAIDPQRKEKGPRMGLLAATLAHEIRNPLASISTNGETLRALLGEGDAKVRYVDSILEEVERLEVLVSSMLRFAGRDRIRRHPVALRVLADDVLARAEVRARSRGVRTTLRGADVETPGDRVLLERLLDNLVRNAIDAMEDGGALTVTVRALPGGGASVEVADTGCGLPDDEEIFEPFFTTKVRGFGLGLPLARRIAERHGGHLTARRTDEGSTLRLELPGGGDDA
jgi:signal transduction histidine kinase